MKRDQFAVLGKALKNLLRKSPFETHGGKS
jgi:hypothetical protein